MVKSILFPCLCLCTTLATAQTDSVYSMRYIDRSTRFAELTLGGDLLIQTGGTANLAEGKVSINPTIQPRFNIGGLHFWGHADLYVSFPLFFSLNTPPDALQKTNLEQSVETGAKVYPWAIKAGKFRPYIGASFQPISYAHRTKGVDYGKGTPEYDRWITPWHLGLTYASKRYLFSVAAQYNRRTSFDYFVSRTETARIEISPISLQLGVNRYMDSDRGMRSAKAVKAINRAYAQLKERGLLSDWYIGIGPTTALQISKSPYLRGKFPYMRDEATSSFLAPEATVGYYFAGIDANLGLAYRYFGRRLQGYDADLRFRRHSMALEMYKFIGNYHGFVPFLGAFGSVERLSVIANTEKTVGIKPSAGIVFGWDIRVMNTQAGLLRTNLRYAPKLSLNVDGEKVWYDHIEFNFIQMIRYLGRSKYYKNG
jgi:hypothetical protein